MTHIANKQTAWLFPGQGSQYPGMGKDFFQSFAVARHTFEEADDILGRKLSALILEGPEKELTETANSQVAIYVVSMAILRTYLEEFSDAEPTVCAGLSLGEYTALTAAGYVDFATCLPLVQKRGTLMNQACESHPGKMAVVLGLSSDEVTAMVEELQLSDDLWAANFNCPGQVVLSGTIKGVEAGRKAALRKGAKRVLPLAVHGAFHSGLMSDAREGLRPHLEALELKESFIPIVMNVTGKATNDTTQIKDLLIQQVTEPVKWEQGILAMELMGIEHYLEIGCGKTLAGFNKRIQVMGTTHSIGTVKELVV